MRLWCGMCTWGLEVIDVDLESIWWSFDEKWKMENVKNRNFVSTWSTWSPRMSTGHTGDFPPQLRAEIHSGYRTPCTRLTGHTKNPLICQMYDLMSAVYPVNQMTMMSTGDTADCVSWLPISCPLPQCSRSTRGPMMSTWYTVNSIFSRFRSFYDLNMCGSIDLPFGLFEIR